jgi:hypothetical protein
MPEEKESKSIAKETKKAATRSPLQKYDEAAEYAYYSAPLREALRNKNPDKFQQFLDLKNKLAEGDPSARWDIQNAILPLQWNDKLTKDEIRSILSQLTPVDGQDPYERFMQLRQSPELGKYDYGYAERSTFDDFSPRDLGTRATTSWEDGTYYYKPEVRNGKLVRKTNLGIDLAEAIKQFMARSTSE